eukprot:2173453-Pleurochrysis_carterae.AAC.2
MSGLLPSCPYLPLCPSRVLLICSRQTLPLSSPPALYLLSVSLPPRIVDKPAGSQNRVPMAPQRESRGPVRTTRADCRDELWIVQRAQNKTVSRLWE